jgi:NADH-ubiquinone oxidoreductase chain 1
LFFFFCTSLWVCTVMIAGWSSDSVYSLSGGLRALAQTISYEVRLAFILLSFVVLVCSYDLVYFYFFFQVYLWLFFSLPLSFVWFIYIHIYIYMHICSV